MVSKIKVDEIESSQSNSSTTINKPIFEVPVNKIQTLTSSSGTLAINCANASTGTITLTENITDIDFTNVPTSGDYKFTLNVTQHASSAKTVLLKKITVNGGSEVLGKTIGGADYTMSSVYSTIDVLTFTFINAGTPLIEFSQKMNQIASLEQSGSLLFNLDFNNPECYDGSGTTVTDLSANNFNFNIQGSPTFSADSDGDKRFTNFSTSAYLKSAANTGINTQSEPVTFTALVELNTASAYAGIAGQGDSTPRTHMAFISYSQKFGTDHWEPGGFYTSQHNLNQKYLVTYVFPTAADRSTANGKIYFSSAEQSKTLYGSSSSSLTDHTLNIGTWKPSRTDMTWQGSIYAVAMWNAALTATEVADNHTYYYSQRFTY